MMKLNKFTVLSSKHKEFGRESLNVMEKLHTNTFLSPSVDTIFSCVSINDCKIFLL